MSLEATGQFDMWRDYLGLAAVVALLLREPAGLGDISRFHLHSPTPPQIPHPFPPRLRLRAPRPLRAPSASTTARRRPCTGATACGTRGAACSARCSAATSVPSAGPRRTRRTRGASAPARTEATPPSTPAPRPPAGGRGAAGSGPSISGVLEAALRLTEQREEEEEEEEEEKEDAKPSAPPVPPPKQQQQQQQQQQQPPRNSQGAPKPAGKAQQQLQFLELRRRQLAQAALRAKRRQDLPAAKELLRRARGVQGLLGAARGWAARGPGSGDLGGSHLAGRCEALAEECRRHMDMLRREHGRGAPPPRATWELRTFHLPRMFPELSSSDLELGIERGRGLPVPPGVAPGDLDTFVRFEFPHPSAEEAQRDKTPVVKSTDCPEFRARFRLRLLRGHRGLRRLLSRGIRLEVAQKGGLFRPERALGSALLRLEGLEGSCELREQLELLDGRRRTGGLLEVWVRIREPLGAQRQLEPRSERWLLLEPAPEAALSVPKPPAAAAPKDGNNRPLPSLNLLLFDRERLERKMVPGRPVPPELRQQHQELLRRIQGLRARLQGGDPHFRTEYAEHLERHLRLYTEAARRLGIQGEREAAKEALYKRNLVESELRKLRG
ncbi:unnamed protein product [Coccothraustes coccothraustes]